MTGELVRQESGAAAMYSTIANPIAAAEQMGAWFASSGMFGITRPAQGCVLALTCLAERTSPTDIMRRYYIIEGRLSMRSDAMLAAYLARGGTVRWLRFDDQEARGAWTYGANKDLEIGYTYAEAEKKDLVLGKPDNRGVRHIKTNWANSTDAMLRARCISRAVGMLCPEAKVCPFTPEEAGDFAPEPSAPEQAATFLAAPDAPEPPAEPAPAPVALPSFTGPEQEAAVNARLAHLGWVAPGETHEKLRPEQIKLIAENWPVFIKRAEASGRSSGE